MKKNQVPTNRSIRKSTVLSSSSRKSFQKNLSSDFDVNRYRYREIPDYSEDVLCTKSSREIRVILPRRLSKELLSTETITGHSVAKRGLVAMLKTKKQSEPSTIDMSAKLNQVKMREQLMKKMSGAGKSDEKSDEKKVQEAKKPPESKSPPDAKKQSEALKLLLKPKPDKVKDETGQHEENKEAKEDEDHSKHPKGKLWMKLRVVTKVGGFYTEVQKKHRYLSMRDFKKQLKRQQKKIPKVRKRKPGDTRAQKYKIVARPDRIIENFVGNLSSSISGLNPAPPTGAHSEPFVIDKKKRTTFMVSSHEQPNLPAATLRSAKSQPNNNTSTNDAKNENHLKPNSFQMEPASNPIIDERKNAGHCAKNHCINDECLQNRRKGSNSRHRGGYDPIADAENPQYDPPIRIGEALAAILLDLNEEDVLLIISPIHDQSILNATYLRVTIVEKCKLKVLGNFLIPGDQAMSAEDEDALARYTCLYITRDFQCIENDFYYIIKYLSDSVLLKSTKTIPRKTAGAEIKEIQLAKQSRWPSPEGVFENARRDNMRIYIRPDFLTKDSLFSCEFFSHCGKYIFSYKFTFDEVVEQWIKSPGHQENFYVVMDVLDIIFPDACLTKSIFRFFESIMKTLKILKAYDYICYAVFGIYKRIF